MSQNKKVSIIIITYNKLLYNKACIESIRKYTSDDEYELIVVDNNSTDGTKEWLLEQKDIKLVLNDENVGFPKGCNMGIEVANKDNDILFLNNDTLVTYNWLKNLKECLYSDGKIGVVGPITNYASTRQCINVPYKNIDDMYKFAQCNNESKEKDYEEAVFVIGFCMLIKRDVFNKAGLYLDERFSPGNYEDNDLCVRIHEQGYKIYICHNTFIHHFGSVSFSAIKSKNFDVLLVTNKVRFIEKWNFDPGIISPIELNLISNSNESKDYDLNILQYNCGLGYDLLKLKYMFNNAKLYGIEKNKPITLVSKNYINISNENIEDLVKKFPNTKFDYVILGEVSGSYSELDTLIKDIKKYLKEDGRIIATVKNSMCFPIIKEYLTGQMTPQKIIRDRKNLFTQEEFLSVFNDNGFIADDIKEYKMWLDEVESGLIEIVVDYSMEESLDQYFIYEYTGKFKKNI